jgi:hypothetical protein
MDSEIKRLCEIDGGIKVYEVVSLPADKFNQWGQINFYHPSRKLEALGPDYIFIQKVDYLQKGNPDLGTGESLMVRSEFRVLRRSDSKLLGQAVLYGRRGGDLPGPWQPSSFSCPRPLEADDGALLTKIFVPSN